MSRRGAPLYALVAAIWLVGGVACAAWAAPARAPAGDSARGGAIFKQRCAFCHAQVAGRPAMGPNLAGVYGRRAGRAPGFAYSTGLKAYGKAWNAGTLDGFLQGPTRLVPGARMMASVPTANDRRDVIAYLYTLKPAAPSK